MSTATFVSPRRSRLEQLLRGSGVTDPRVIGAILAVPRELFVFGRPDEQSVPQPCALALQLEQLHLRPTDRVLQVGTGSGYPAAVLSQLVSEVVSVDPDPDIADAARERLATYGYARITVAVDHGAHAWFAYGPFDAVVDTEVS